MTNLPPDYQSWFSEIEAGYDQAIGILAGMDQKGPAEGKVTQLMMAAVPVAALNRDREFPDFRKFGDGFVLQVCDKLSRAPLRDRMNPPMIFATAYVYAHVEMRLMTSEQADALLAYLVCRIRASFPNRAEG